MVWSRYGCGTVEVRSRFGRVADMVQSRFGHGTVVVLSRYSPALGMLPIRSWYGTLKVRSRRLFSPRCTSNLVHALYDLLFAVRSRCGKVHCTLWVCSLFARGTVHSRFIPAWYSRRASNLVHVLYVLLFASRNRGLTGFGSAGSDR